MGMNAYLDIEGTTCMSCTCTDPLNLQVTHSNGHLLWILMIFVGDRTMCPQMFIDDVMWSQKC